MAQKMMSEEQLREAVSIATQYVPGQGTPKTAKKKKKSSLLKKLFRRKKKTKKKPKTYRTSSIQKQAEERYGVKLKSSVD